jgi:N-acetylglucosamine kinase-like BadF-type ATPase
VSAAASPTLLLCYDGSDRAMHAIAVVGQLFPGATAKVVNVWEPVEHIVARYAALAPYLGEQITEADAGAERESSLVAQEGAKHAEAAGLTASAHNVTLATTVWEVERAWSGRHRHRHTQPARRQGDACGHALARAGPAQRGARACDPLAAAGLTSALKPAAAPAARSA